MRQIAIILLALLIITNNGQIEKYTISMFLKELKETGLYDIIAIIKCEFGANIAIDFCKEVTNSPYCEEAVRVYMDICSGSYSYDDLKELLNNDEIMKILLKYISLDDINRIIKKLDNY